MSKQGYLLLRHSVSFPYGNGQEFDYDHCYDAIVNGERIYILTYSGSGHIPSLSHRFTLLTENFGTIEIAITKVDGKVTWTFMDSDVSANLKEEDKKLNVISEFFGEYWSDNCLVIIDYESINEGRLMKAIIAVAVILILQAAPLFITIMKDKEDDRKYQVICHSAFCVLQILVMALHFSNYITLI